MIHCGSGPAPGEHTGPEPIRLLLQRYPRLRLVVAHLGMPEYAEFLDICESSADVRLDTTMAFTPFVDELMPLPLVSECEFSSGWHPFSGLFPSPGTGSLPRFIATCPARPGLMVGSTLDGGPDWADGAITRSGYLVAREVDRGVVVALMDCPAAPLVGVAGPLMGPADVLHVPAGVAGFRRRVPAVSDGEI
jgi:hypothetical protein